MTLRKKQVLGLLVEILSKATFNNHFYKWKGKIFHQRKGGAIGLRLTGVCAKVVMDKWMDEFVKVLESNGIHVFLIRKYVDDILLICTNVNYVKYWDDKNIQHFPKLQRSSISDK